MFLKCDFIDSMQSISKCGLMCRQWCSNWYNTFSTQMVICNIHLTINCVTQLMLYTGDKLSSTIFCCLSVRKGSVSPDQISTFSNIYRHTSPLLTMYHLIPSSTNLYWPSNRQYHHILTQYHQVPLIIHHLGRHSSANWIFSLFTTHLMSHAPYAWSSSYQLFDF